MNKKIIFDLKSKIENRAFLIDSKNKIEKYYFNNLLYKNIQGNIYLVQIVYIDYNLKLAFVDYGDNKNGFISFDDISDIYMESDFTKSLRPLNISKIKSTNEILENYLCKFDRPEKDEMIVENQKNNIKLKVGQFLLAQVIKNGIDNKGATFSTKIVFNTKYFVFSPFNNGVMGISKNIPYIRAKIKNAFLDIFKDAFNDDQAGFIFRSSGANVPINKLIEDISFAINIWNSVLNKFLDEIKLKNTKKVQMLYAHDNFFEDVLYEFNSNKDYDIIVNNNEYLAKLEKMNLNMNVKYQDLNLDIYDNQILSLYNNYVYLPSGGFLVIQKTEALYSIDINSGSISSKISLSELNKEAAYESARQIKLRNMSGIIVIDFIENKDENNVLFNILKNQLEDDKVKINVLEMNSLGLISISRQRKFMPFWELNNIQCNLCLGKGFLRGNQVIFVLKMIERELIRLSGKYKSIEVVVNNVFLENLFNLMKEKITKIEKILKIQLNFISDLSLPYERFILKSQEKELYRYDNEFYYTPTKKNNFFSKILSLFKA